MMSLFDMIDDSVRIFELNDWQNWLDRLAKSLFGMNGEDFERAWLAGNMKGNGIADDLSSVLLLIDRLRRRMQ